MYISVAQGVHVVRGPKKSKRWTVATARQHLPRLLAMAAHEPQAVYRRNQLVATVVNPTLGTKLAEAARQRVTTLADELAQLRQLCASEDYALQPPKRVDRGKARRKRTSKG